MGCELADAKPQTTTTTTGLAVKGLVTSFDLPVVLFFGTFTAI